MSLEEAAAKVKISKKSLDDYLMQLRMAKKYNFDFERHRNDKIGVVRTFVKMKKAEEKRNQVRFQISKDGKITGAKLKDLEVSKMPSADFLNALSNNIDISD